MIKKLLASIFLLLALCSEARALTDAVVLKIVDGDTIKVRVIGSIDVENVRLIGIDAPEKSKNKRAKAISKKFHTDIGLMNAEGKESFSRLVEILPIGAKVRLEFDVDTRDRYGRMLAYVRLKNGEMVNEMMIRDGYAYSMTVPPNVKYADKFKSAFKEAREKRRGLWR